MSGKRHPRSWYLINLLTESEKQFIRKRLEQYKGLEVYDYLIQMLDARNTEGMEAVEARFKRQYSPAYLSALRRQAEQVITNSLIYLGFHDDSFYDNIRYVLVWLYLGNRQGVEKALPVPDETFSFDAPALTFEYGLWRILSLIYDLIFRNRKIDTDTIWSVLTTGIADIVAIQYGELTHSESPLSPETAINLVNRYEEFVNIFNKLTVHTLLPSQSMLFLYHILASLHQKLGFHKKISDYVDVLLNISNRLMQNLPASLTEREKALLKTYMILMLTQSAYTRAYNVSRKTLQHALTFVRSARPLEMFGVLPTDFQIALYPQLARWYAIHGYITEARRVIQLIRDARTNKIEFASDMPFLIAQVNVAFLEGDVHNAISLAEQLRAMEKSDLSVMIAYIVKVAGYVQLEDFRQAQNTAQGFYLWTRRAKVPSDLALLLRRITNRGFALLRSDWKSAAERLQEIYKANPLLLKVERGFPFYAWLESHYKSMSLIELCQTNDALLEAAEVEDFMYKALNFSELLQDNWLIPLQNFKLKG